MGKMPLASFQNRDEDMEGTIKLVRRDVLLSNPGLYGIPDEQLHFPFLYESDNGNWYMTYREGPHFESKFGSGNRVQCVQSRDRGRTWLPWMGMHVEPCSVSFLLRASKMGGSSVIAAGWRNSINHLAAHSKGRRLFCAHRTKERLGPEVMCRSVTCLSAWAVS